MKKIMMIMLCLCTMFLPTSVGAKENLNQFPNTERKDNPTSPQVCYMFGDYNSVMLKIYISDNTENIELYRATSKNGKYTKVKDLDIFAERYCEYTITLNGLVPEKTYYYKLRATSDYTGKHRTSKYTTFSITTHLSKPNLYIYPSATGEDWKVNKYDLCWNKVSGAQGYVLYRSKDGDAYKKVIDTKKTSYLVKTKHNYTWRIRAYRKVNGKKVYSAFAYADANWKYLNTIIVD